MGKESSTGKKNPKQQGKSNHTKPGIGRSLKEALSTVKKTNVASGGKGNAKEAEKKGGDKKNWKQGNSSNNGNTKFGKGKFQKKPPVPKVKPNVKLVTGMKGNWNKLRDRSTGGVEKDKVLAKMVEQMKGHVLQVTLRHDASRMVQSIMQFGNAEQREQIFCELVQKTFEIAKTPYGHFAVLKAITYCTQEADQKRLANSLKQHFVSLGTNVIGARTVESVMQLYPAALTKQLKAEFYGQKFTILASSSGSLRELIAELPASKTSSVLDHMRDLVAKFVHKGLLAFTYVHQLIWEYAQEVCSSSSSNNNQDGASTGGDVVEGTSKASRIQDLIGMLAESAAKLLATKAGARTICLVITHANAKDRKRMLKTLKTHALESLLHDSAHLGVMRLVDVTDDTVNVQKMLFDELKSLETKQSYTAAGELKDAVDPPLLQIATHQCGCKLLLRLLAPTKQHLEPDEEFLFSAEGLDTTSKKSPQLRRKEHLTYFRQPLTQMCLRFTEQLMRSRNGSRVLAEVINTFRPKLVLDAVARVSAGVGPATAAAASAEEDSGPVDDGDEDEDDEEEEEEEDDEEEDDDDAKEDDDDDDDEEEEEDGEAAEEDEEFDEDGAKELLAGLDEDAETTAGGKKGGKAPQPQTAQPLFSIEEDPVAHTLMKKILKAEADIEQQDEQQRSAQLLWQDAAVASDSSESYANVLISYLADNNAAQLCTWLAHNRPCFVLLELMKVPSSRAALVTQLSTAGSAARLALEQAAAQHKGGELLKAEVEGGGATTTASSKNVGKAVTAKGKAKASATVVEETTNKRRRAGSK